MSSSPGRPHRRADERRCRRALAVRPSNRRSPTMPTTDKPSPGFAFTPRPACSRPGISGCAAWFMAGLAALQQATPAPLLPMRRGCWPRCARRTRHPVHAGAALARGRPVRGLDEQQRGLRVAARNPRATSSSAGSSTPDHAGPHRPQTGSRGHHRCAGRPGARRGRSLGAGRQDAGSRRAHRLRPAAAGGRDQDREAAAATSTVASPSSATRVVRSAAGSSPSWPAWTT